MEREPNRQAQSNPEELTGQAPKAYPNNMAESTGEISPVESEVGLSPKPPENKFPLRQAKALEARRLLNDPNTPVDVRRAAQDTLINLLPKMAGGAPDDPNPDEPITPQSSENTGSFTSPEALSLFAKAVEQGVKAANSERGTQKERLARQFEDMEEKEVINAIAGGRNSELDPFLDIVLVGAKRKGRDQFFNDLFTTLDNRPEEFSDMAFGQLTDEYTGYNKFMKALARIKDGRSEALDSITDPVQKRKIMDEIRDDYERYQKENTTRKILHDASAILYVPGLKAENLFGYVEKFESSLVDMVITSPGIRQMIDLYEHAIRESMATHEVKGYLDPQKIRSVVKSSTNENGEQEVHVTEAEIDKRTKELFRNLLEKGMIKSRTKDGKEFIVGRKEDGTFGMEEWEINRLFGFARGVTIASGRLISIAADSKLPPAPTQYATGFLQDIVGEYSALRHTNVKWGIASEGLAAYLYKGSTGNVEADRLLKRWNPRELKEMWERFGEDQDKVLNSLKNSFYLGRINPNRAGDVWTWMSWRAENRSDAITMTQDFLLEGERKMANRWNEKHGEKQLRAEAYINFIKNYEAEKKRIAGLDDEEFFNLSKTDREQLIKRRKLELKDREEEWKRLNPDVDELISVEDFEKYYKEYEKWTGTGFRFEKMRPKLEKAIDYSQHGHGSHEEQHKEKEKLFDDARDLLKRMSEIQGHRLYGVSEHVRKRIDAKLSAMPGFEDKNIREQKIQMMLGDMMLAESAMLNSREDFLKDGISFDKIQLDMSGERDFFAKTIKVGHEFITKDFTGKETKHVISLEERIRLAKEFARISKEDYVENKDDYFHEFVTKREYTHGFVLWSGDVPLDEYNASAIGTTGVFTRRARDNKNQALATGAETKLLDNLKNIHSPEQLYEAFEEIYAPIEHYDKTKAQQAVAEKLLGVLKFYKTDSITKIPAFGLIWKNVFPTRVSFAKMMYGNHAMALESSQIRHIIEHFGHNKKITHEQEKWLLDKLGATEKHMIYELGLDAGELGFMGLMIELMVSFGKEIGEAMSD